MDRRQFLTTSSIAAGAALLPVPARAAAQAVAPSADGDARLNALFEEVFQDRVQRYPELATSLGLDKGENAHLKSKLDVRPAAQARKEDRALAERDLARLKAVPETGLSDAGRLNREVIIYQVETGLIPARSFNIDSVQRPYPIFQQGGVYFSLPDFLNSRTPSIMPPMPRLICRAWRWRGRHSTMTAKSSAPRPLAASLLRPGPST